MSADRLSARRKLFRRVAIGLILLAAPLLLWLEFGKPSLSSDPNLSNIISMTLTRLVGAAVFFALILSEGYRLLSPVRGLRPVGAFLAAFVLPLAVVINNFPLPALIAGEAEILPASPTLWAWFLLECLAIALFEEAAFRGFFLPALAERCGRTKRGLLLSILLSSAVFGLVHLVNLAGGAGIGGVLRQIGYSFLVGAMCAVVLIKTHNLWLCVILHATFDVGGKLIETVGEGRIWTTPAIVITATLAVLTTAYLTVLFFRPDPRPFEEVYPKNPTPAE